MLVKTDQVGYMKDTASGAMINTDDESYKKFLAARAQALKSNELDQRISGVENDLKEIKDLLLGLINGKTSS